MLLLFFFKRYRPPAKQIFDIVGGPDEVRITIEKPVRQHQQAKRPEKRIFMTCTSRPAK